MINLTPAQTTALKALNKFVKERNKPYIILSGFAGCGKTTILSEFAKTYPKAFYCAPTNKAVKVLKEKIDVGEFKTIHSFLGLAAYIDDRGVECFKPNRSDDSIHEFELVIIDECSMVSSELFEYIKASEYRHCNRFIFVGDCAQLPPVGEEISPIFNLNCEKIELTEVLRHDGAILDFATNLRENPMADDIKPLVPDGVERHKSNAKWIYKILDNVKIDTPDIRVICWTNQRRKELNEWIRGVVLEDPTAQYQIGERLICNKPVYNPWNSQECLYNTSDEFIIEKAKRITASFKDFSLVDSPSDISFQVWKITTDDDSYIYAIAEESAEDWKRYLNSKKKEIIEGGNRWKWRLYYELKNTIADVDYAYCLTAHKSQGSTYKIAFVDALNILKNPNIKERNQCLYVAVTRASEQLILNLS